MAQNVTGEDAKPFKFNLVLFQFHHKIELLSTDALITAISNNNIMHNWV